MKIGLIFDMDGTLWDSAKNVADSWNEVLEREGYEREPITEEDMFSVMGKTMDIIADILFPMATKERRTQLMQLCGEYENEYLSKHGGRLYDGLKDTLAVLKEKYHLYIVSNCQSGYIEAFLDYYGMWDLFEDIECYGNNGFVKGKNIRLVADRNELDRAIYVGDIQGDYDASMEAGVEFIHAAYGFGKIDAQVPRLERFVDLPELLNNYLLD